VGLGRRRHQAPEPVSVNARLKGMELSVLTEHAEVEIMMAGHCLSRWRESRIIDPSLIDQGVMHAEWALEALRALQQRERPGRPARMDG